MYHGFYPFPPYLKKEDALVFLKKRYLFGWVVIVGILLVFFTMEYLVTPRLLELYHDFDIILPFYASTRFRYFILFIVLLIILLTKPESEEMLKEKLRHYKNSEMISTSNLINHKYELAVYLALFTIVFSFVFTIIMPIYTITSNF